MNDALLSTLQTLIPDKKTITNCEKLFGEASYREYYRVHTAERSYILMKLPAGAHSIAEEVTQRPSTFESDEMPFLNIARYLQKAGLPAPQVVATQLDQGMILLEDLGDKSLESLVIEANRLQQNFFYQQAIDLLLQFQQAGKENPDSDCIAFHRSFSAELLEWELQHFVEYGIEDRFQIQLSQKTQKHLKEIFKEIAKQIVQIPYSLTHRDFQSRNLLMHGYDFYLIDFQDALKGPPQYDLVALLRDSYIELTWEQVTQLGHHYFSQAKSRGLLDMDEASFWQGFHLITLQRKLKDTGRFQFIKTVKNNPKFLPHVPASLNYVKQAFSQLPQYQNLQEIFAESVAELR